MGRILKKNLSIRQWLFGDFDKDGSKNIDDPKPLDPKVKSYPKKNSYYQKSRFGGGEVKLSTELRALQRHNNKRVPILKKFLESNKGSKGRIKTVPSTMKKLRERYGNEIKDIAGVRVITNNRSEAKRKFNIIKSSYKHDPKETDNYYEHPKGEVYRAYHTGLIDPKDDKLRLEVQLVSKEMSQLNERMHSSYKRGQKLDKFKKKGKKLYDKGY